MKIIFILCFYVIINFVLDKDIPGVGELMLASFPNTSKFDVENSSFKWYLIQFKYKYFK